MLECNVRQSAAQNELSTFYRIAQWFCIELIFHLVCSSDSCRPLLHRIIIKQPSLMCCTLPNLLACEICIAFVLKQCTIKTACELIESVLALIQHFSLHWTEEKSEAVAESNSNKLRAIFAVAIKELRNMSNISIIRSSLQTCSARASGSERLATWNKWTRLRHFLFVR